MNGQSHAPGNADTVHSAYSARAHEYIDLLGDIDTTAPEDRALVTRWARDCTGRVVDIGCGPGHWTAYLSDAGVTAEGIDPVPEFVDHAQRTYPQVQFRQGTFDDLGDLPAPFGRNLLLVLTDPPRPRRRPRGTGDDAIVTGTGRSPPPCVLRRRRYRGVSPCCGARLLLAPDHDDRHR